LQEAEVEACIVRHDCFHVGAHKGQHLRQDALD
jgi:hypothetical protein